MRRLIAAAFVLPLVAGCDDTAPRTDPASRGKDTAAIEAALNQWPVDFNAERIDEVCGLFAEDVVLVYPDSPDRDHREFCDQMRGLFADPSKSFGYEEPDIREITVDGDLATVRLVWTLTVRDAAGETLETVKEDGLDVFTRQADGSWKILVSHAFTRE